MGKYLYPSEKTLDAKDVFLPKTLRSSYAKLEYFSLCFSVCEALKLSCYVAHVSQFWYLITFFLTLTKHFLD